MQKLLVLSCAFLFLLSLHGTSQDTLPRFSVVAKASNRNLVSWTNSFPVTTQISIQRSSDSLKNFITILSVPDPGAVQNGFVDARAGGGRVFYRLFIVLENGKYLFTASKRPGPDTSSNNVEGLLQDNQRVVLSDSLDSREVNTIREKLKKAPSSTARQERFFVIKKKDVYTTVAERNFRKFRDSIVYSTRDTILFASVDTVVIKPFVPVEVFRASKYVYTERYGNVMISIPDAGSKKYSIRFFEENKKPLFDIEELPAASLIVDKSNFVHSGWFWFELFENGDLKERHRFFIPKEF